MDRSSFISSTPGSNSPLMPGVPGPAGGNFEHSTGWVFWHPGTRMVVSILSITLAVVLYAEDPVGHSEERAVLGFAGPIVNLFLCGLLNWDFFCLFGIVTSVGLGFVVGKQVLHPFLRNNRKWTVFGYMNVTQVRDLARQGESSTMQLEAQRSKGRLTLQLASTVVALFLTSQFLPVLTSAAGLADCSSGGRQDTQPSAEKGKKAAAVVILPSPLAQLRSCSLGSRLPTTNTTYTRWMAVGTLGLDLVALLFLMETMLSDAGKDRVVVTASTVTTAIGAVSQSASPPPGSASTPSSNTTGIPTVVPSSAMAGAATGAQATQQQPLAIGPGSGGCIGGSSFVSSSATTKLLTRAPYFKGELQPFRVADRALRSYTLGLPPTTVLLGTIFIVGVYMLYYVPLRWLGSCTELGRVFLASARLLADVILVLQDWEFPHFRQMKKVHLGPVLGERIITGKWLNFGVLACTLVLDANTVRYHLNYDPARFGQMVKARTDLIVSRRGRHAAAYTFFEHYSFFTKFLFTFPVWIGIGLLLLGLKRWKIIGIPTGSLTHTSGLNVSSGGSYRDHAPSPLHNAFGGNASFNQYQSGYNPIPAAMLRGSGGASTSASATPRPSGRPGGSPVSAPGDRTPGGGPGGHYFFPSPTPHHHINLEMRGSVVEGDGHTEGATVVTIHPSTTQRHQLSQSGPHHGGPSPAGLGIGDNSFDML